MKEMLYDVMHNHKLYFISHKWFLQELELFYYFRLCLRPKARFGLF